MSIFSKWRKKREAKYSAVYAGPEQMSRRNRFEDVYGGPDMSEPKNEDGYPENRKDEDRPLETVYGGPRTEMEEDLAQEIPPEPVMAPVYGGPEMMGGNFEPEDPDTVLDEEPKTEPKEEESVSMKKSRKVVFGRVYAGPERMSRANPFEDVYAGPEPEDDPVDEEPAEEPEPEEKADPDLTPPEPPKPDQMDPRLFMAAYAGPQFYNNGPQYQLVYAGPQFFNPLPFFFCVGGQGFDLLRFLCRVGGQGFDLTGFIIRIGRQFFNPGIGAAAPMQPEPAGKTCPSCGSLSPLNAKFCPECGKPFPKNACPGCGNPLPENTLFCPECGMPCKKETEEET